MASDNNKKRILFVDDDQRLRDVIRTLLIEAGYEYEDAGDGISAIQKLQDGEFDLLLLDITLPGKSGIDVLRFVREKALPMRIVILTGTPGLRPAVESVTLGVDDYITKPYKMEYLLASIGRLLDTK